MQQRVLSFEEACQLVRERKTDGALNASDKAMLYVYYKVATDADEPRSAAPWNPEKRRYYDAWRTYGPTVGGRERARQLYVLRVQEQLQKLC